MAKLDIMQWQDRYDDELYTDFLNTSESEYINYDDFLADKWEEYNESQYELDIENYDNGYY